MPGAPLHAPQGPTGLLPTIFTSEHPSPEFFFLLLCPFPQRHCQDQALWWNLLELPRQCHILLTELLRRFPEAIFLGNIPLLLARVLLFAVEVSPCHMWRKSAPKSHIGLLWLHRCVPTQPSVPRMGGSWQEPDKLLHLLKLFCISNFASNFLTYHLACSHRILVKAALLL